VNGPRKKFALGRYVVDPNQTFPAGFIIRETRLDGKKNTLAREVKNVLSLVCGQHKCVARFLGWNLKLEGDQWIFVTVLKPGRSITVGDIANREKFVIGVASGMAKLHSLGICHDEFTLGSVGIDEDGCPLIGGFGLIPVEEKTRFTRDAQACVTLFQQLVGGRWAKPCGFLEQKDKRSSFDEFLHRVREANLTRETVEESTAEFPFELLVALTNAKKWEASDGIVGDVIEEIARLIGVAEGDIAEVTAVLRASIDECHSLDRNIIPDF
jgi:hypothetical protein